ALRAVPPVKRGGCRGSVVPGSPKGDPATDDPGSPSEGTTSQITVGEYVTGSPPFFRREDQAGPSPAAGRPTADAGSRPRSPADRLPALGPVCAPIGNPRAECTAAAGDFPWRSFDGGGVPPGLNVP